MSCHFFVKSSLQQPLNRVAGLLLATIARLDPLTGLPLRYSLEHDFELAMKICQRNKTQLYVVMIDADHFKAVNDNYGHPIGDLVLCYLADLLREQVRSNEQLYRYGGEEFLVLMQAPFDEAIMVTVQRFLQKVRDTCVPVPDKEALKLTVTLGLACVVNGEGLESAVERADQSLYAGKVAGRDRYVFAEA